MPTGVQNVAEIGRRLRRGRHRPPDDRPGGPQVHAVPLTLFIFILFCNICGIIPVVQMPANARIALPVFMALLVYVIYHGVGFKEHGPISYLKNTTRHARRAQGALPPVTPIEFVIKFIVQPLQHGGPTLRQPARRPPPARHLRGAHRAPCGPLKPSLIIFPSRSAVVFLHRLRGAGRVPPGLHLHDARRRVHRPGHQPRALISTDPHPSTSTQQAPQERHRHRMSLSVLAQEAAAAGIDTGPRRPHLRRRRHRPRHRHRLPGRPAVKAMARQPEAAGMVRTTMFLGIAFIEALALFGFVVFFLG